MKRRETSPHIRPRFGLMQISSVIVPSLYWTIVLAGLPGCVRDDSIQTDANQTHAQQSERGLAHESPPAVEDLDGKAVEFPKLAAGAPTVVLFTRSDCPISNRCAPEIARLHEKFAPQGVAFYLVYVDPRETPAVIREHMKQFAYPCRALRDPRHALVAHCQATVTPEAALFDRAGEIVYRGRVNDQYADLGKAQIEPTTHELADAIAALLADRPITIPRTKAVGCSIADVQQP